MKDNDLNQSMVHGDEPRNDLKTIRGIGSGVEARLNAAGIYTYAHLALQTADSLVQALKGMVGVTPERIAQQRWIEQAAKYAESEEADNISEATGTSRQYYETFTVELLLADDQSVRRTRVTRVQNGVQESWAGFQFEKLVEFLSLSTGVQLSVPSLAQDMEADAGAVGDIAPETGPATSLLAEVTGVDLLSQKMQKITHLLPHGQPFDILLELDLAGLTAEGTGWDSVPYNVIVYARQLGSPDQQIVSTATDLLDLHNGKQIRLNALGLPPGFYRIIADLHLDLPGSGADIQKKGSLLQVV
jgi:hypothetical protein